MSMFDWVRTVLGGGKKRNPIILSEDMKPHALMFRRGVDYVHFVSLPIQVE